MPANSVSSTKYSQFLKHKIERCSGGHSKVKLTGLAAGNATGESYPYL